jgi:O-succinylbenzoic acid--CoA ligase
MPAHSDICIIDTFTPKTVSIIMDVIQQQQSFMVLHPTWPDAYKKTYINLVMALKAIPKNTCFIATSGTSGDPKLCAHAIDSLVSSAKRALVPMPYQPNDDFLLSLFPSKMGGLMTIVKAMIAQGTIVFPDTHWADHLHQAVHLTLVPQQLATLWDRWPKNHAIRSLLLGGDAVPMAEKTTLANRGILYSCSYGLTETAGQIMATPFGCDPNPTAQPLNGVSCSVNSDQQLCVAVDSLAQGYITQTGLQALPLVNGMYTTHDIVEMAPFRVIGRQDFQFQNGSTLVSPEYVESVLLDSGYVRDAMVIPQPHDRYGHVPIAYVDTISDGDALRQHVNRVLPVPMRPLHYIKIDEPKDTWHRRNLIQREKTNPTPIPG